MPILTGFTSGLRVVSEKETWLIDGVVLYRLTGNNAWEHYPELYQCSPANIAKVENTQCWAVAQRRMPTDTAWWLFRTHPTRFEWQDSVQLNVRGRFLGASKTGMLFSASAEDEVMFLYVINYSGAIATILQAPTARNNRITTAKVCADSIIISDPFSSPPAYDVVRKVSQAPDFWEMATLRNLRYGAVGEDSAFVFLTDNGAFLDYGGEVRPLASMADRIQDLAVCGKRAARISQGGVETTMDITEPGTKLYRGPELMVAGVDNIVSLKNRLLIYRSAKNLEWFRVFLDAVGVEQVSVEPMIDGSCSRGPRYLTSGETVAIADHWRKDTEYTYTAALTTVRGSTVASAPVKDNEWSVERSPTMLATVNNYLWLGTWTGVYAYPGADTMNRRTGYAVAYNPALGEAAPMYMHTDRGIEVRQQPQTPWRLLIPGVAPVGMVVMSDTVLLIRAADITDEDPEVQFVVDAYDSDGLPFFGGVIVADSAIARGYTFRSVTTTPFGIIVNMGTALFVSTNAGATWRTVDPGVEVLTPLATHESTVAAWCRRSNGEEGPALMINPSRFVLQTTPMRSAAPVHNIAIMPGWFVFSTSDGIWSTPQLVSSINHTPPPSKHGELGGVPDETLTFDILGRPVDLRNAPTGAYFVVQRHRSTWVPSTILHTR